VRRGHEPRVGIADDEPDMVKHDEVLVRVQAAGVNMADVDYLRGLPQAARLMTGLRRPKNRALGLDLAGTVEMVGKGVTRFQPGDEVFGWWLNQRDTGANVGIVSAGHD
jgi:NADPH:quinone reductase-like Zn-dependent oxidoreductase